ncbi:6-pyruvoyl-tetrahydropterin synthase-related protein [Humisphaera borealis]|uniref:Membrane protein 6-pyruvoyl-tetrahydropterin synthase-related domain-containing protein n=1 Tax=Humisphaera borealis TaxID=2807512 RepID=A0A7M2WTF3_9BACT|nr:6-pyruvoyl-tetrahydropterin synthase-related protein [Humisphaera borealis]QOV88805.1 hypothetical protein IPV69_21660 [Humisphaera borealis]
MKRPRPLRLPSLLRSTAAIALTALLSLGVLAPYFHDGIYQNGDLWNFLGGVVEARNALAEGQFPLRVAPNQLDGRQYPVFQFYANLPYTVAGFIMGEEGRNPYSAWKWTMFAALMIGGLSIGRLAWRWTRSQPAALSAIAVFLSAPYLMTNLNDRGAVAEVFAISLLPAALLATWTCMVRRGLWRSAVCAIAWTALGLTHNITYLYGATFISVFILSFCWPRRRVLPRLGRLALAGLLHALMLVWYVAPQFALMPQLAIAADLASPAWSAELVPLAVLLWPICRTPAISTIPRLGLQIGWLVLAGVACAFIAWTNAFGRGRFSDHAPRRRLQRGLQVRLLVLWAVAIFIVWTPVDFWPFVPKLFYFVQFTYRLLGFVLLFGALLAALGLAGIAARSASAVRRPGFGRRFGWIACLVVIAAAALTQFAYYPPGLYHPRGSHRWINDRPIMGGLGDYVLRPQVEPPLPAGWQRVPAETFAATRPPGALPVFRAEVTSPTRIVLPVLWYPNMLRVTVNGRPSPYGASGTHVTVDLPPGRHRVAVRFDGLDWANNASTAGAALTLAILGWKIGTPLRGRRRRPRAA